MTCNYCGRISAYYVVRYLLRNLRCLSEDQDGSEKLRRCQDLTLPYYGYLVTTVRIG